MYIYDHDKILSLEYLNFVNLLYPFFLHLFFACPARVLIFIPVAVAVGGIGLSGLSLVMLSIIACQYKCQNRSF